MKRVVRMLKIEEEMFVCLDDIPTISGSYNGIYFNENKPWFHLKECTVNQSCVANWKEPITEEECTRWIDEGVTDSIIYWKEAVACADTNLYIKVNKSFHISEGVPNETEK